MVCMSEKIVPVFFSFITMLSSHYHQLLPCTGVAKIWSTKGELIQSLEGPGDAITWIDWHPKGDILLAGSEDYSLWMWGARIGQCMQVPTGRHDAG